MVQRTDNGSSGSQEEMAFLHQYARLHLSLDTAPCQSLAEAPTKAPIHENGLYQVEQLVV